MGRQPARVRTSARVETPGNKVLRSQWPEALLSSIVSGALALNPRREGGAPLVLGAMLCICPHNEDQLRRGFELRCVPLGVPSDFLQSRGVRRVRSI